MNGCYFANIRQNQKFIVYRALTVVGKTNTCRLIFWGTVIYLAFLSPATRPASRAFMFKATISSPFLPKRKMMACLR